MVIFWPYNAFPNGEIEFFCFGEYALFDLLNMCCKVWRWHERMKRMCATVLWRIWSLAVNILEDIISLIVSKTFNCMFQFLHDMVEDTAFYHWGHFSPCNAFPNGEVEIFCLGQYDLFDLPIMHCEFWNWQDGQKWIYAKKLELSSEYFGGYCKKLLNQFLFYIFQDIQLKASVPSWYDRGHCILSLYSFLYLTMHFQRGK